MLLGIRSSEIDPLKIPVSSVEDVLLTRAPSAIENRSFDQAGRFDQPFGDQEFEGQINLIPAYSALLDRQPPTDDSIQRVGRAAVVLQIFKDRRAHARDALVAMVHAGLPSTGRSPCLALAVSSARSAPPRRRTSNLLSDHNNQDGRLQDQDGR
jgi:hypothetical protein